jgi:hypothetical protein
MFDVRQSIHDEHGEQDEASVARYIKGVMEAFVDSPEAQPIIEQQGSVSWPGMMLNYYFGHIGGELAEMSLRDFNEVVFELFPRKVSTEPESAPEIVAELKAFWSFVHRQYGLEIAERILATLNDEAVGRLRNYLSDPSRYGMAKSFVMGGKAAGFDMTKKEDLDAYAVAYNASLLGRSLPPTPADIKEEEPPPLAAPQTREQRDKKRADRKRERQAKKRNRK